jgi:hypothetical protein
MVWVLPLVFFGTYQSAVVGGGIACFEAAARLSSRPGAGPSEARGLGEEPMAALSARTTSEQNEGIYRECERRSLPTILRTIRTCES